MTNEEIKQTVGTIKGKVNRAIGVYKAALVVEILSDAEKLIDIADHLQKTIEAQAEEIKALQAENNGCALAMGVLKSEYDKQAEEIRLWKELNKAQSAYMDSQYWQPPDGIGGSDEALAAWMKARTALSAFDSTRDKHD